jgi:hypothetical protein
MITQEIKLYEEPPPYAYQAAAVTTFNGYGKKLFNHADLVQERNKAAFAQIKIGSRFRYKKTQAELEIVSYETDPFKCEDVDGFPAVLKARRTHPVDAITKYEFHYSVAELLDEETLERL